MEGMKCTRCPIHIQEYESYLVYENKKYCKECIVWMIFECEALPNDGSIKGGSLAKMLSEIERTKHDNKKMD